MPDHNLEDPTSAPPAVKQASKTLTHSMKPVRRNHGYQVLAIQLNAKRFDGIELDLAWMKQQISSCEVLREVGQTIFHSLPI